MPVRAFARSGAAARWARRQRRRKMFATRLGGAPRLRGFAQGPSQAPCRTGNTRFAPSALPHAPTCAPGTAAKTRDGAPRRSAAERTAGGAKWPARPLHAPTLKRLIAAESQQAPQRGKGPCLRPTRRRPGLAPTWMGPWGKRTTARSQPGPAGAAARARPASRYARGRRMMKSLPAPTSLCTSISPCMAMTMCLTIARPSPVPPMARERPLSTR